VLPPGFRAIHWLHFKTDAARRSFAAHEQLPAEAKTRSEALRRCVFLGSDDARRSSPSSRSGSSNSSKKGGLALSVDTGWNEWGHPIYGKFLVEHPYPNCHRGITVERKRLTPARVFENRMVTTTVIFN